MAQAVARIEQDLLSEPHVSGRRISVLQIYELVEEAHETPRAVADRYDLDVADIYHALAYYYDHPRQMANVRRQRRDDFEEFKTRVDRPPGVSPE